MPVNYYSHLTEDELLDMLSSLQQRGTKGAISFVIAAGMQQQRSFQNSRSTEIEIRRVLYALHVLDPVKYENPYVSRIRRTLPSYS